jgi:hypothetical protein
MALNTTRMSRAELEALIEELVEGNTRLRLRCGDLRGQDKFYCAGCVEAHKAQQAAYQRNNRVLTYTTLEKVA